MTLLAFSNVIPRPSASTFAAIFVSKRRRQTAQQRPSAQFFEASAIKSPRHQKIDDNCSPRGFSVVKRLPARTPAKFRRAAPGYEWMPAFETFADAALPVTARLALKRNA